MLGLGLLALYNEVKLICWSETLFLPPKLYCMEPQLAKITLPTPLPVAALFLYYFTMITFFHLFYIIFIYCMCVSSAFLKGFLMNRAKYLNSADHYGKTVSLDFYFLVNGL